MRRFSLDALRENLQRRRRGVKLTHSQLASELYSMSLTSVLTQTSLFLRFAQLSDEKRECAIKLRCVALSFALVTLMLFTSAQGRFLETLKDPESLADAQKAELDIEPITGEEMKKMVSKLSTLSPSIVAKLKEILETRKDECD